MHLSAEQDAKRQAGRMAEQRQRLSTAHTGYADLFAAYSTLRSDHNSLQSEHDNLSQKHQQLTGLHQQLVDLQQSTVQELQHCKATISRLRRDQQGLSGQVHALQQLVTGRSSLPGSAESITAKVPLSLCIDTSPTWSILASGMSLALLNTAPDHIIIESRLLLGGPNSLFSVVTLSDFTR